MKYSIFSLCTKGYRDAYDFVINSWLNNTNAEKIYIYTNDNDWRSNNKRVKILTFSNDETNWNKIVAFKTDAYIDIYRRNITNSVFLDIDCYVFTDIGHVFEKNFDFAVTRLYYENIAVNSGVVFTKRTEKLVRFYKEWRNLEYSLNKRNIPKPRTCSNNQKSFSDLIRKKNKTKQMNILDLDAQIYNRKAKPEGLNVLLDQIHSGKEIKILHFVNNSYRNLEYVEVLKEFFDFDC